MLRRTAPVRRVGDFLSTIPTDAVSRAIFTLGSAAPAAASSDSSTATSTPEAKCEEFARDLMTHFHSVARSSSALRRRDHQDGKNDDAGLMLGVKSTLLHSPLARAAGLDAVTFPSSNPQQQQRFAWASPSYSKASKNGVVNAWVGKQVASSSSAAAAPSSPVFVVMSQDFDTCTPTETDGAIRFVEATAVSKEQNGRLLLKLGNVVKPSSSSSPSSSASEGKDDDEGNKNAALLLSVQSRLNHAAFAYGTLRAIARDAVLAGATATTFRSGSECMLDSCGVFHDRLAAIEAYSHVLLAATHFTAFQVAETLYVPTASSSSAAAASSSFARDLAYDSGLLHLLSRSMLRTAHHHAERTFLRHGPLVDSSSSSSFVAHSFRGAEHWINSVQNMDVSEGDLCETMAAQCCEAAAVQKALAKAGASSGGAGEQLQKVLGKVSSKRGGGSAGVFSDVHMNIKPVSNGVAKDFDLMAQTIVSSSSSAAAPASGDNKKPEGKSTTTSAGRNLLQQHAYAPLIMPFAAEVMGSACALYHSTNAMELMDGMQQQDSSSSAPSNNNSNNQSGLSADAAAAIKELYPGAAASNTAPVYRTAAEAGAVAWLALEVGLEASKVRRAQLLRDLTSTAALGVSDQLASAKATHPVELPRSEQKKKSMDEDEEAQQ